MTVNSTDLAGRVLGAANSQIGVPYRLGSAGGRTDWADATKPHSLFDCSGFVAWAYYQATGVKLPAFTDALASDPRLTEVSNPIAGDIVLFKFTDPGQRGVVYPHTAIYAGNGRVVESGSANGTLSAVNSMPLLTNLNPHFYRLKDEVISGGTATGDPVVTVPGGPAIVTGTTPTQTASGQQEKAPVVPVGSFVGAMQTLVGGWLGPGLQALKIKPDMSGLVLLLASLFALLIGALIWRGDDVKGAAKQAPQAATAALLA